MHYYIQWQERHFTPVIFGMTFKKSILVVHNRSLSHMKFVVDSSRRGSICITYERVGESVNLDIGMVGNYPTKFHELVEIESFPPNSIFIVGENMLLQADAIS
jgi:hypothetical protein